MYLLAKRTSGSVDVARHTAVAYGLWANWGSIDYSRWGGLPNLAGMSLFIGALTWLATPPNDRGRVVQLGVLVAAMILTHHHVMLTAACVFLVLLAYWSIAGDRTRRNGLLAGLAIACLLDAFYLVPYALKARDIASTSVLTASEPAIGADQPAPAVGAALLVATVVGLLAMAAGPREHRPGAAVLAPAATLAALFVAFEYGYPSLTAFRTGAAEIAFTPSRFLTDLVYLLTIVAGYGVSRLRRALGAPASLTLIVALLLGVTQRDRWLHLYTIPTLPPATWEAYLWIQTHTRADAIVLDDGRWGAYGTWRRTIVTSLPVSEPDTAGTAKRRLTEALQAGHRPPEAAKTEVVAIRAPGAAVPGERVLWTHPSGLGVVEPLR
jgi:hypothetical protein